MLAEPLTRSQVKKLYRTRLRRDFPRWERKPLRIILMSIDSGSYECYGLTDSGKILGYAFFVRRGTDYLLDYLATDERLRGRGLGAEFIKLLQEKLENATSIIAEAENPEFARTDGERSLQERRLKFYSRNGFGDTGVRSRTFGVEYVIIELPAGKHTEDETESIFTEHYKAMLPEMMYRKEIKVHR